MKKTIYIAILCLTFTVFSQQEKSTQNEPINGSLTFGRNGADCRGRGVCSFETNVSESETNTTITYNKDNTLTLVIDRTKITTEDEVKIIGKQLTNDSKLKDFTFVMEEAFILNKTAKQSLKTPKSITKIAIGNYPIEITETAYIIVVKLE